MTQQEIQERNRDIALMLGLHHDKECVIYEMKAYTWDMLRFHSDWRWLMDAVEFIEKKIKVNSEYASDYNVVFDSFSCSIETTGYHQKTIININNQNKKEAVFIAVSQFAKLYNNKQL